jgi:hypothetical protein
MTDVEQTKETPAALELLAQAVADLAKDGIDFSDKAALAEKLVSDAKFCEALIEAVKDMKEVPAEPDDIVATHRYAL